MWTVHLLKPVAIYVTSVLSAERNKDLQGALLKMLLSFGTIAASLWPAVKTSAAYQHATDVVKTAISVGRASLHHDIQSF